MRNLKKILALALALVMTLSVMSVANAFTDDANINETYAEAVDVLAGLKVFQGYTDGSYQPKGEITRAEVAAIVYRIVTGDVDNTQVGIYADNNKFTDVASNSWYAGYVNFCANAEYILGYGDGRFGPNDKVTGYQALAMILRAIGYGKMGEFTGKDWDINTASRGEALGITKNITAGTLGVAATREVVAEILFRAILVPQVTYTLAFGYAEADQSLGYKTFKLEEIEGVVVANEFADLYDTEPLAAGKTQLETEDKTYTLAYSTDLTDIGEARYAYVTGSKVLAIADAGNTVYENDGAGVSISTSSKFSKVTGMSDDAEHFINFGGEVDGYESDYRIEYVYQETADSDKIEKVIRAGALITEDDMTIIKNIFAGADKEGDKIVLGEVYVGTKSGDDVSDEISFKKFKAEYITERTDFKGVESADNGEWLKVIDNDGDGKADYVFLTTFTMTTIVDHNTKKDYFVFEDDTDVEIDEADIVTEDELAVDDVVLYTLIDGVYYVNVVTPVAVTIDKKGINYKEETITCDGETYSWSGIEQAAEEYYYDISDAETEENYDLYLDHFGYVRLYTDSGYNRGFVLLTDAYFETDKRDDTFKAQIWDTEAEDFADVEVVDSKSYPADVFVDTEEGDNGNRGTWDRLIEAGHIYFAQNEKGEVVGKYLDNNDPFITNIAAYSVSEDGYNLAKVQDASNKTYHYAVELDLTDAEVDDKTFANVTYKGGDVQATTKTQYYFVQKTSKGAIAEIYSWVGYANAPKEAVLAEGSVGYAVTIDGEGSYKDNMYDVAQVIVFESYEATDSTLNFVYALDQKWYDHKAYDAWTVSEDVENETYAAEIAKEVKNGEITDEQIINFFDIYTDGLAEIIDEDFADHNIYLGLVRVAKDVYNNDYVKLELAGQSGYTYFNPETTPAFVVYQDLSRFNAEGEMTNVRMAYAVEELEENYDVDDVLVVVTNNKGAVQYVINVSESYTSEKDSWGEVEALNELAAAIYEDAQPEDPFQWTITNDITADYTVKGLPETAAADEKITFTVTAKAAGAAANGTVVLLNGVELGTLTGGKDAVAATYTARKVESDADIALWQDAGYTLYTKAEEAADSEYTLVADNATYIEGNVYATLAAPAEEAVAASAELTFTMPAANVVVSIAD